MRSIRINYALDADNNLIESSKATPNKDYFCPSCFCRLNSSANEFSEISLTHPQSSNCIYDEILIRTSIYRIFHAITENINGSKEIILLDRCARCNKSESIKIRPGYFASAILNDGKSSQAFDIFCKTNINTELNIKITMQDKSNMFDDDLLGYIELNYFDATTNPYYWNPARKALKKYFCRSCRKHFSEVKRIAEKWGIPQSLFKTVNEITTNNYVGEFDVCFKCKEEIPIFWWSGVPFCEKQPPLPRPSTIQYRYSKNFGGSYWANTCPNCNSLQGDNYLYHLGNAPLKDLPTSDKFNKMREQSTINSVISRMLKNIES